MNLFAIKFGIDFLLESTSLVFDEKIIPRAIILMKIKLFKWMVDLFLVMDAEAK